MIILPSRLRTSPHTHPGFDGLVVLMVFLLVMKDDLYFVVAKATDVRAWKLNPSALFYITVRQFS